MKVHELKNALSFMDNNAEVKIFYESNVRANVNIAYQNKKGDVILTDITELDSIKQQLDDVNIAPYGCIITELTN